MKNELPYWKFEGLAKQKYKELDEKEYSNWLEQNWVEPICKPLGKSEYGILCFTVFTTEEKDYLRGRLRRFEPETVEKFLLHLEILCQDVLILMEFTPQRTVHIKALKKMKKSIDLTMKYLKLHIKGRIKLDYNRSLVEKIKNNKLVTVVLNGDTLKLIDKNDNELEVTECEYHYADEAYENLYRLTQLIENKLKSREGKRGRAESYATGFVKAISEIYERYFEKATNYQDGPFYGVVIAALDAVGLPSNNPRRAVEKALKGDSAQK